MDNAEWNGLKLVNFSQFHPVLPESNIHEILSLELIFVMKILEDWLTTQNYKDSAMNHVFHPRNTHYYMSPPCCLKATAPCCLKATFMFDIDFWSKI